MPFCRFVKLCLTTNRVLILKSVHLNICHVLFCVLPVILTVFIFVRAILPLYSYTWPSLPCLQHFCFEHLLTLYCWEDNNITPFFFSFFSIPITIILAWTEKNTISVFYVSLFQFPFRKYRRDLSIDNMHLNTHTCIMMLKHLSKISKNLPD